MTTVIKIHLKKVNLFLDIEEHEEKFYVLDHNNRDDNFVNSYISA